MRFLIRYVSAEVQLSTGADLESRVIQGEKVCPAASRRKVENELKIKTLVHEITENPSFLTTFLLR